MIGCESFRGLVGGNGPPLGKYGNSDGPLSVGLPGLIKIWNFGVVVVWGVVDVGEEAVAVLEVAAAIFEAGSAAIDVDVDARLVTIHVVSQISIDLLLLWGLWGRCRVRLILLLLLLLLLVLYPPPFVESTVTIVLVSSVHRRTHLAACRGLYHAVDIFLCLVVCFVACFGLGGYVVLGFVLIQVWWWSLYSSSRGPDDCFLTISH